MSMTEHTLVLPLLLSQRNVSAVMKTQRLTVDDLQTMQRQCSTHPEIELRVIVYCPACRGQHGGTVASKTMTK